MLPLPLIKGPSGIGLQQATYFVILADGFNKSAKQPDGAVGPERIADGLEFHRLRQFSA
jgi:hypothetical protein